VSASPAVPALLAAGAAQGQPGGARLPRPSTTRFLLLILMVCAAAMFAAYWWLVELRGNWVTEQAVCLAWLGRGTGEITGFNGCITGVVLRQEGVVLLGPAAVLAAGLVVAAVSVPLLLRFWRSPRPPPESLAERFEACLAGTGAWAARTGNRRRPRLVAVRRGTRGEARAFGFYPRYWVLADPLLVAGSPGQLTAVLRHELAHLQARDVDRARLARSVWGVFFVLVAPALIISVARQGGLAWLTVGLRLLVLWALIHLTFQSLLRAREHEADLLAAATQAASPAGAQTEPLAAVLTQQLHGIRSLRRGRFPARLPAFARAHPTEAQRAATLAEPRRAARLAVPEFLSAGVAAGVIFQEVAFAVGAPLPGTAAYWITGAVVAVPVCLVTVTALWRHELAGPGPLRYRAAAAAGALLGAGLLAGSQLSPRAATNWRMVQLVVSPVLPANLSIWVAGAAGLAALSLAAVAGGTLFTLWALAVARRLGPAVPGERAVTAARRLATGLAVAVLAVPLGALFAVCRLAADSANDGPQGASIAGLLQSRTLLGGLAATAALAAAALIAASMIAAGAARRRQATAPERGRGTATGRGRAALPVAAGCAAVLLVPAAAWSAGAVVRHAITPGPPLTAGPGSNALPLLPPGIARGTGPIGPGGVCYAEGFLTARERADPAVMSLLGGLFRRTPDRALEAVGVALTQASLAQGAAAADVAVPAWLAAGFRCNIIASVSTSQETP